MVEEWRIMGLDVNDAYTNMAIDEAICRLRSRGKSPNTIRIYRWLPSAVSIGYFQLVDKEVNLEACKRLRVDVVRRMTGGGAVYHDYEGEVTYSVIVNQDHPRVPRNIVKSYELICSGVVNALKKMGIKAEFKPINDIVANGKKISGNAQTRRWGVVIQHGTILVDTDVRTMFKVLRVSKEKISDKLIKSAEERVTTIRRELGGRASFEEVSDVLKETLPDVFGVRPVKSSLSEEEKELANQLRAEKYSTRRWVFERPAGGKTL